MSIDEVLTKHSAKQLSEWAAYERITGPLGAQRFDLQAGIIAATVANAMSGKAKAVPADFIPKWDRRPLSPEELFSKVKQLNAALGGTSGNHSVNVGRP